MRLLYYLYIYLKKLYHRYAPLAIKWYWAQNDKVRHRVGWAIVLTGVCLCGVILWSIILGVRQVGFWINGRETVTDSLAVVNPSDADEPVCLDWYSGDYKHRKFKCKELNPKRNVILYRDFKDLNDVQLIAARRLGVRPLAKRDQIEKEGRKLVKLKDTRFYHVDPMTHSVPCLVPDAADFLTALGERWQQYHKTNSRFIITSCLRTQQDIKRLRRGNVNATKESCHLYGTTFDITYVRFDRRGKVRDHKLKADLARALYDMKAAGHCYVKYEYRQSCFHVTVRPR